jgi:pimeloyl-ACP methyl ester carboxylesterase
MSSNANGRTGLYLKSSNVGYRLAGVPAQARDSARSTFVFLHGIGSGADSWSEQLNAIDRMESSGFRALAWDAPGYGQSNFLEREMPKACDYSLAMWRWLDSLSISSPITLVGHSLGALIATNAALHHPHAIERLVLLSPAQGYGDVPGGERAKIVTQRLSSLVRLGPAGMAQQRAHVMLSPTASAAHIERVRSIMAEVQVRGYAQAVYMLSTGTLVRDLLSLREARPELPIVVASGQADQITSPEKCDAVAMALGQSRINLGEVGHACALEGAHQVNRILGLEPVHG